MSVDNPRRIAAGQGFANRGSNADQTKPILEQTGQEGSLQRLAELVASGATGFPKDLNLQNRVKLITEVAKIRRQRLITFIARAIAKDIVEVHGHDTGVTN